MTAPPDLPTASAVARAVSLLAIHPRDQDALAKYVLGHLMAGRAVEEDLFGGLHVAISPPTASERTWTVTVTATAFDG